MGSGMHTIHDAPDRSFAAMSSKLENLFDSGFRVASRISGR